MSGQRVTAGAEEWSVPKPLRLPSDPPPLKRVTWQFPAGTRTKSRARAQGRRAHRPRDYREPARRTRRRSSEFCSEVLRNSKANWTT